MDGAGNPGQDRPAHALKVLLALVGEVCRSRPFGTAVRLEAFYQHYARHILLSGASEEPMSREAWWEVVILSDPEFAGNIVLVDDWIMKDAEGAQL